MIHYGNNELLHMILKASVPTREENDELLKRAKDGDAFAIEELIIRNGKLILSIIKKYSWNDEIKDDLLQEGILGLYKAIEEFDFSFGTAFSTYAVYWINQSVNSYVVQSSHHVFLPQHIADKIHKIKKVEAEREAQGLCLLSNAEMADRIHATENAVMYARMNMKPAVPLDANTEEDCDTSFGDTIPSDMPDVDSDIMKSNAKSDILRILNECLTERELKMLQMKFGLFCYHEPHTFEQVGDEFHVSKQRAEQIIKKAISKLRQSKWLQELKECDIL